MPESDIAICVPAPALAAGGSARAAAQEVDLLADVTNAVVDADDSRKLVNWPEE